MAAVSGSELLAQADKRSADRSRVAGMAILGVIFMLLSRVSSCLSVNTLKYNRSWNKIDDRFDLNELLVNSRAATFFCE